jgi:hypothetical protein
LGPDPPPEISMKFIDFYAFLVILGSSIEPEKASAKSASTPYPPRKVKFMLFFNNSRPNFVTEPFFIKIIYLYHWDLKLLTGHWLSFFGI